MKKECQEHCNICDVDFSKDNGYGYAIDELKAVRAHIDEVIRLMETRIKKDAILDEVLNTSYEDDEEENCCCETKNKECTHHEDNKEDIFDFDKEVIEDMIAKNNIKKAKRALKLPYPLWSMYSRDMWF